MNQVFAGGHSIAIQQDRLMIDGKIVDVKLKRSLFGGYGGVSVVSSGDNLNISNKSGNVVIQDSNGNIYQNYGSTNIRGSATIKIGRNKIVIKSGKIIVNGKEVVFGEEKPASRQSLDEQLNKNAQKYLISTAKEDEIEIDGEICRRIVAMGNIVDSNGKILVKKGQKGGFVAGRDNLSEYGPCWVYGDAVVGQDAKVKDSAKILDKAKILGSATVGGHSQISEKAEVHGSSSIGGNVDVSGNANIHGNVSLGGNVKISDNADVHGNVSIGGNVEVSGNADIHGNVSLGGNVKISGNANLQGNVSLSGNEVISNRHQSEVFVYNDNNNSVVVIGNDSYVNLSGTRISGRGTVVVNGRIIERNKEDV